MSAKSISSDGSGTGVASASVAEHGFDHGALLFAQQRQFRNIIEFQFFRQGAALCFVEPLAGPAVPVAPVACDDVFEYGNAIFK